MIYLLLHNLNESIGHGLKVVVRSEYIMSVIT